jgi:myo-inositol-hexaphosphate 3-phosphohydrolase
VFAAFAAAPGGAFAAVTPVRESAPRFEEDDGADADDPAIWVNSLRRGRSVVVGTLKDAGLTVLDLERRTLQDVSAPPAPGEGDAPGRFNNVDVVYDARVGNTFRDLALVSDRGRDQVRTYAIDLLAASLYEEVDTLALPASFRLPSGGSFTPCVEAEGEGPQVEGMTVDAGRGLSAGSRATRTDRRTINPVWR